MRPAGPACAAPPGHGGGRLPAGPGARIAAWRRHRRPPSPSGTGTDPAAAAPRRPHPTRKWAVTGSPGCRREHRPRASASCRARPRRPGLCRPVPLRSVPGCRAPECPVPQPPERPPPHSAEGGGAGARRDGGAARGTLGAVVPCGRRTGYSVAVGTTSPGMPRGPGRQGALCRRGREGAVAERPGRGRPSDRPGPEAAPGTADGARGLCVLLAARDECRNPVREEPRPTFGLCMVTGFNLHETCLAVLWGSVMN
ncbi:annexin A4 isoform X2 [Pyrgilauda ruficollis]|uniref:annexin A4 isoform X2 n=1 Tax=Pyrgilauda ruficollis TaxID=221976 RepID=UPI001B869A56|nr:annexin A4 isoform X2 [Pyrgilauda ruficollis]